MANHDDSTIHYICACKYTINFLYVCILCVAVNVDVSEASDDNSDGENDDKSCTCTEKTSRGKLFI